MKVSVLITTYNLENYISETLDSVLSQKTDFPFEILIGDDGSDDHTMEILQTYRKRNPDRIRIFTMPREAGKQYNRVERSAENRLNLLRNARGEYCTFLDGDDYYIAKDKLLKQVRILDQHKDCIMCAHNLMLVYENGEQVRLCKAQREHKFTLKQYWKLMFLQANAVMFRNISGRHMPKGSCARYFDDNNITFWLFQHGKMYYLPECMGAYRQVAGSSWNAIDKLQKASSNIIGYCVEIEVNRNCKWLCDIRHYPDFSFLYRHQKELSPDACAPFYQTAKQYGLKEAVMVYEMNRGSISTQWRMFCRLLFSGAGYYAAKAERGVQKMLHTY